MRFDLSNYVDCQERINRFWVEHPDGAIVTKLMSPPDDFGQCRYEACVYRHLDDARPSATGYAFELAGGNGPNSTSHEENCETSAIGRALANMGYAKTREDRPSQQEMGKVNRGTSPATRPEAASTTSPARLRSTTTNTAVTSWTAFWSHVEALGLPRDKRALEAKVGSIGIDPALALAKVQAWHKDAAA